MTIEQFFSLKEGDKLYNAEKKAFCIVHSGAGVDPKDIPDIVAKRLLDGPQRDFNIIARDMIHESDHIAIYQSKIGYHTIIQHTSAEEWVFIRSLNEIDNQKLINTIMFIEINKIEHALFSPQDVTHKYAPPPPPQLLTAGTHVNNSLNLQ